MKIMLDLNVLLDVVQNRHPHYKASADILSLLVSKKVRADISGHAVTTIYYLNFARR